MLCYNIYSKSISYMLDIGIYSVKSNLWMYKMITIPICISHIYMGDTRSIYSIPVSHSFISIKKEFQYDKST
jgi:hypothetical protein